MSYIILLIWSGYQMKQYAAGQQKEKKKKIPPAKNHFNNKMAIYVYNLQ
mgnify:CR=1 FL=1